MTPIYVFVNGPYDFCFVGPFDSWVAARAFAHGEPFQSGNAFSATVMSDAERTANIAEFGPAYTYPPEIWIGS